jgi:4-hydroxythreonine-4-phosphate dehydrogenase
MNKIAVTTGDPNGIGAEITIKALNILDLPSDKVVIISNKNILDFYGKLNKDYEIINIPYDPKDILPGQITKETGEFSYKSLKKACEILPEAIVTAPVAKKALHLAGYKFNGQTEIIEKFLSHDNQLAEMLFIAKDFRVLLLTRHCALKDVKITEKLLKTKVKNLVQTFQTQFGIKNPRFALCALNPHAGEDGILGREEIDIIIPAVKELQAEGLSITMPLPADTLFVGAAKNYFKSLSGFQSNILYDCYIANYHDQGLIPIKTVAGDKTVNMTIGLDIIRTSPGHGTAFDIAGKNIARPDGMIEAIKAVLD